MTENLSKELTKIWDIAKSIDICMMNSRDEVGSIRSRPMSVQKKFDGIFLFLTELKSGKVSDLLRDQQIGLSFADPKTQTYLSVSGKAEVVRDEALVKGLWNPLYAAWFPNGPEDPNIAVLKVVPDKAEYWDAPANPVIMLLGLAKAAVTGQPYGDEGAEHKKSICKIVKRPV